MKKFFLMASSALLATSFAAAQDVNAAGQVGATTNQQGTAQESTQNRLQGCLSGSSDNYTLTDANGTIYHLRGASAQLAGAVGHEVQLTGTPERISNGDSGSTTEQSATNGPSFIQVSEVRDTGKACKNGRSGMGPSPTGAGDQSTPMSEKPPIDDTTPKGAPGQEPPPHTQLIAELQQPVPANPASQDGANNGAMNSNPNANGQAPQSMNSAGSSGQNAAPTSGTSGTAQQPGTSPSGDSATTPVTNQTPASSTAPTNRNMQPGSQNPNASTSQSESGVSPQADQTTSSPGNPGAATPNAAAPTPNASSSQSATPQVNQNDQNKPLYERQATDIPWARHSGNNATPGNTNNPTTPQSNNSTTPQSNPQ